MSPADHIGLARLKQSTLEDLEELYLADGPVFVPEGCYRGTHLTRLATPGARTTRNRLIGRGFETAPFGVDFAARAWFFFHRRLLVGRFDASVRRSRWRPTDTVALEYGVSRLPGPIRAILYDEVRPLSDSLCLGLGGINAERGAGDLFFFALERIG